MTRPLYRTCSSVRNTRKYTHGKRVVPCASPVGGAHTHTTRPHGNYTAEEEAGWDEASALCDCGWPRPVCDLGGCWFVDSGNGRWRTCDQPEERESYT